MEPVQPDHLVFPFSAILVDYSEIQRHQSSPIWIGLMQQLDENRANLRAIVSLSMTRPLYAETFQNGLQFQYNHRRHGQAFGLAVRVVLYVVGKLVHLLNQAPRRARPSIYS